MSAWEMMQRIVKKVKETDSIAAEVDLEQPLSRHGFDSDDLNDAIWEMNNSDEWYAMRSRSQDGKATRVRVLRIV